MTQRRSITADDSGAPALLREFLRPYEPVPKPSTIHLSPLWLTFIGHSCDVLERAFQANQSQRYKKALRILTPIFLVFNLVLIAYDYERFIIFSSCRDDNAFFWALMLRSCIMAPTCVAVFAFTFTPWYRRSAQPLVLAIAILGGYVIAYSIIGKDPGYGTLALLIVFLYSFTPISFWRCSVLCVLMLIAFGVGLYYSQSVPPSCSAGLSNLYLTTGPTKGFNIMGVLVAFTVIVGVIGYSLELDLRRAFLDEFRLQFEAGLVLSENFRSESLLSSILPPTIINFLKKGRPFIVEAIPEVTVLFCELQVCVCVASQC